MKEEGQARARLVEYKVGNLDVLDRWIIGLRSLHASQSSDA